VRCMRLIAEELCKSSVILRQTADRVLPSYSKLASVTSDSRHVASTAQILWTDGSRQLAVLPSQVKLIICVPAML